MKSVLKAFVPKNKCVACGSCMESCPVGAISIFKGIYAKVNTNYCIGCKKCLGVCPISIIHFEEVKNEN
ncbi:4Fe-4S binding protein [Fusobacterium sp. IOR10]|uniref:4Fe-4S binding protein n=1 Tax=Fusobacterium sp. IOR10 TaxID=2665157 RepID=UPI0013D2673D|nr:4Fe-4S binding protein [Fusobacterium sp. IOR10]